MISSAVCIYVSDLVNDISLIYYCQVMCTYITGHLNTVFPAEHRREILRYIYYHQVEQIMN